MEKTIRINKYLASSGICSRREADRLVQEGVVKINGKIAESGSQVWPTDVVTLRGKRVFPMEDIHVLAYYKPIGVTCTERDPNASRILTKELDYPVRVTYAGRLDKDSEGLLLLTNEGSLIDGLMRGKYRHEKEYIVKVDHEVTPDFQKKMEKGVYLQELEQTTRPCQVTLMGKYTFSIIITQGLNRQIRRMCKTLGYRVASLKRIRVANITLEGLKPGEFRRVEGQQLEKLYALMEKQKRIEKKGV